MNYDQTSVLIDGQIPISGKPVEQLFLSNPPGFFIGSNKDSIGLLKGTPVAVHSSGTGFVRAQATSPGLAAYGILAEDAPIGFAKTVLLQGTLVIDDWTSLIGQALLQPKALYYLSLTAGQLTNVSPVSPLQISQLVGQAVSTVALDITIMYPILL